MLKMGQAGLLAALWFVLNVNSVADTNLFSGPPFPAAYLPAEVTAQIPKDFDYFHELILIDELARCGHAAAVAAITNGPSIAVTVILRFGTEEMKRKIVPEVLLGRKFMALAISEPQAGSGMLCRNCPRSYDVAWLSC